MKQITKAAIIDAPVKDVYNKWTTKEGLDSFFGADSMIELRIGGPYEIYFLMDQPYGLRGSEYCVVLHFQENKTLAFTWNVPPQFDAERRQRYQSIVKLYFEAVDDMKTRIELVNEYREPSDHLDEILTYFERAWDMVLKNLKQVFQAGE